MENEEHRAVARLLDLEKMYPRVSKPKSMDQEYGCCLRGMD